VNAVGHRPGDVPVDVGAVVEFPHPVAHLPQFIQNDFGVLLGVDRMQIARILPKFLLCPQRTRKAAPSRHASVIPAIRAIYRLRRPSDAA
jgi:hypothetical protein